MMALYKSTWVVLVVAIYLKAEEVNLGMILPVVIICMVLATFIAMYLAAKESISLSYAKRNLTLAIVFTFIGGLGFIIWPFLVNSEIEKFRAASGPTTT